MIARRKDVDSLTLFLKLLNVMHAANHPNSLRIEDIDSKSRTKYDIIECVKLRSRQSEESHVLSKKGFLSKNGKFVEAKIDEEAIFWLKNPVDRSLALRTLLECKQAKIPICLAIPSGKLSLPKGKKNLKKAAIIILHVGDVMKSGGISSIQF